MPKVTDEYLMNKRNYIVACANDILNEKPINQVTMRDIIKKAGFSQGAIYRYYNNIDEIFIDLINKNTIDGSLEQKIDLLLCSDQANKTILYECIVAMGKYMEALLASVGGKTFFGLLVYYTYDHEKRNKVFPQLKFKQILEYALNRIMDYLMEGTQKEVFHPTIALDNLIRFIGISFDGITLNIVLSMIEEDKGNEPMNDISEMFQVLANAVVNFLKE